MPFLSRKDMEVIVRNGGSVLFRGRIIVRETDLPTVAELAQGDPVAETQAIMTLQEHIDRLTDQVRQLTGQQESIQDNPNDPSQTEESGDKETKKKS